jgi:hydroxymethylpyrimidine/phosphomethylpyrimidine kinase
LTFRVKKEDMAQLTETQTKDGPRGRVLVVAGSDSGGGAGIQADIKAITAMGGFAMTAVTAITVQNTLGVSDVHPIPVSIVVDQIKAVASDLGVDVFKTGMLGTIAMIETVREAMDDHGKGIGAVVDPVMIAKGGHPLLEEVAIGAMRSLMVPRASLLTPNAPEAERLADVAVDSLDGQRRAGERLLRFGAGAVLVKGGHIAGARIVDVLATPEGEHFFEGARIDGRNTHGTGCTLASAIAAGLSKGRPLVEAIDDARTYLEGAIRNAPGLGKGHGPLNHAWRVLL